MSMSSHFYLYLVDLSMLCIFIPSIYVLCTTSIPISQRCVYEYLVLCFIDTCNILINLMYCKLYLETKITLNIQLS